MKTEFKYFDLVSRVNGRPAKIGLLASNVARVIYY